MNKIVYSMKAIKQLRKIPSHSIIRNRIDELCNMPDCINVKALKNHKHQYRLRVGDYRVLFNFERVIQIVSIEEIRKRDEQTY